MSNHTGSQINISVAPIVHAGLCSMAKKAGQKPSSYAAALFMAAYTARCSETGDRDLDAAVARVMVLHGTREFDTALIAQYVGLSEATVVRIVDAWKSETSGRIAA